MGCTPSSTGTGTTAYEYADSGTYGISLLDEGVTKYSGVDFSFVAFVPENGELYVVLSQISGGRWNIPQGTASNWVVSNYNYSEKSQVFTVISPDVTSDCLIELPSGTYRLDYYEGEATSPTRTKEIKVN